MIGLKRLVSTKNISVIISIVSLVVALISLALSLDTNRRNSEQFIASMTAILKTDYDRSSGMLHFQTTEPAKALSWGTWFLPAAFHLKPIIFKAPESAIDFAPVAKRAGAVLNHELARIHKLYPRFPPQMQDPIEFAVPVFCELQTTTGGSSVRSTTVYVLVTECISEGRDFGYRCEFKTLAHNGRLEIGTPGFFHSPYLFTALYRYWAACSILYEGA